MTSELRPKTVPKPDPNPDHDALFGKTKMCSFHRAGRCTKGLKCSFAHGTDELNVSPDLQCTRLCRSVIRVGTCTTPGCTFAHSREQLRPNVGGSSKLKQQPAAHSEEVMQSRERQIQKFKAQWNHRESPQDFKEQEHRREIRRDWSQCEMQQWNILSSELYAAAAGIGNFQEQPAPVEIPLVACRTAPRHAAVPSWSTVDSLSPSLQPRLAGRVTEPGENLASLVQQHMGSLSNSPDAANQLQSCRWDLPAYVETRFVAKNGCDVATTSSRMQRSSAYPGNDQFPSKWSGSSFNDNTQCSSNPWTINKMPGGVSTRSTSSGSYQTVHSL